ncbi:MAG: hypothetical protein BMS9Abin05_1177 [Rhodothermia bacterium]|nr:MAG: hypothetical protein BMS9Abin05_1177 [Rhodothermia bacterium]
MGNQRMILIQNTRWILSVVFGFVVLFTMNGCRVSETGGQSENLPPDLPFTPIHEIQIHTDDPSPVVGRWEVVDYLLTSVSAIGEDEAIDWLGQLIVFSENAVGVETELCDAPSFEERTEVFDEFFSDYGVKSEFFGVTKSEVDVITVRCNNAPWSGAGSELFRVVGDTIVVVYDGIFLSLEPH